MLLWFAGQLLIVLLLFMLRHAMPRYAHSESLRSDEEKKRVSLLRKFVQRNGMLFRSLMTGSRIETKKIVETREEWRADLTS